MRPSDSTLIDENWQSLPIEVTAPSIPSSFEKACVAVFMGREDGTFRLRMKARVVAGIKMDPKSLIFGTGSTTAVLTATRTGFPASEFDSLELSCLSTGASIREIQSSQDLRRWLVELTNKSSVSFPMQLQLTRGSSGSKIVQTIDCFWEGPRLTPAACFFNSPHFNLPGHEQRFAITPIELPIKATGAHFVDEKSNIVRWRITGEREIALWLNEKPTGSFDATLIIEYTANGQQGMLELPVHVLSSP